MSRRISLSSTPLSVLSLLSLAGRWLLPFGSRARALLPLVVLGAGAAALGCQPSLPDGFSGRASPADPPRTPEIQLEPEAAFDTAPLVLRARIVPAEGEAAEAARVLLVRGHVGEGHVRQVANDDLSQALTDRILPSMAWGLDDGSVVLAPTSPLEPGATYGVLSGDPPLGADIHVATGDTVPLLRRVWPPADAPAGPFEILCGEPELASPPPLVALGPGDIAGTAHLGAIESLGRRCLRIDATIPPVSGDGASAADPPSSGADSSSGGSAGDSTPGGSAGGSTPGASTGDDTAASPDAAIPPPLLALADGTVVRLDPTPISLVPPDDAPAPAAGLDCASPDVSFGPGCARVADDRLLVTTPDEPLLWVVRVQGAAETVRATRAREAFVVLGLAPGAPAQISIAALDALGRARTASLTVSTAAPMAHVVLSEVLANPLGAEPDQEWVEIYNDGLAEADLSGYTLTDLGGVTALPQAVLPPGAFALIVNDTFVEDDEIDAPPAPGTALLRVPALGKSGLKNDGEPLKLLDAGGDVVSRFPAAPKPKPGQSVARVSPSAPDADPNSFMVAPPTPGAPNNLSP